MFILGLCIVSLVLSWSIVSLYKDIVFVTNVPAIILMLIGCILMVVAWSKKKIQNDFLTRNNKSKQKYCNVCNINVAGNCSSCPVCGGIIKEEGKWHAQL